MKILPKIFSMTSIFRRSLNTNKIIKIKIIEVCRRGKHQFIWENIQVLTKSENCSKGVTQSRTRTSILQYDWRTKYATVVQNQREISNPGNPF